MDIVNLYAAFIDAGQQPCNRDDPLRGLKMRKYRTAKKDLFAALRKMHLVGQLQSDRADKIISVIAEASANPEAFWGSAKAASKNQSIFLHEKHERLFDELLRCYQEHL